MFKCPSQNRAAPHYSMPYRWPALKKCRHWSPSWGTLTLPYRKSGRDRFSPIPSISASVKKFLVRVSTAFSVLIGAFTTTYTQTATFRQGVSLQIGPNVTNQEGPIQAAAAKTSLGQAPKSQESLQSRAATRLIERVTLNQMPWRRFRHRGWFQESAKSCARFVAAWNISDSWWCGHELRTRLRVGPGTANQIRSWRNVALHETCQKGADMLGVLSFGITLHRKDQHRGTAAQLKFESSGRDEIFGWSGCCFLIARGLNESRRFIVIFAICIRDNFRSAYIRQPDETTAILFWVKVETNIAIGAWAAAGK